MTGTLTFHETPTLSLFDDGTLTARELARTPHDLDPTCNRATLATGEVYFWNKRRGVWVLVPADDLFFPRN